MPTSETLERFIARVEQNAHIEAIEEFYTADASTNAWSNPWACKPRAGWWACRWRTTTPWKKLTGWRCKQTPIRHWAPSPVRCAVPGRR